MKLSELKELLAKLEKAAEHDDPEVSFWITPRTYFYMQRGTPTLATLEPDVEVISECTTSEGFSIKLRMAQ